MHTIHTIPYVHTYVLANLRHTAQVLPSPRECVRQIVSAIAWFKRRGTIFRAPLSTLQRRKEEGGWGLIDMEAKCQALLITRMWTQSQHEGSASAEWQHRWRLPTYRANPPHVQRIPKILEYVRIYALEMAYVDLPK